MVGTIPVLRAAVLSAMRNFDRSWDVMALKLHRRVDADHGDDYHVELPHSASPVDGRRENQDDVTPESDVGQRELTLDTPISSGANQPFSPRFTESQSVSGNSSASSGETDITKQDPHDAGHNNHGRLSPISLHGVDVQKHTNDTSTAFTSSSTSTSSGASPSSPILLTQDLWNSFAPSKKTVETIRGEIESVVREQFNGVLPSLTFPEPFLTKMHTDIKNAIKADLQEHEMIRRTLNADQREDVANFFALFVVDTNRLDPAKELAAEDFLSKQHRKSEEWATFLRIFRREFGTQRADGTQRTVLVNVGGVEKALKFVCSLTLSRVNDEKVNKLLVKYGKLLYWRVNIKITSWNLRKGHLGSGFLSRHFPWHWMVILNLETILDTKASYSQHVLLELLKIKWDDSDKPNTMIRLADFSLLTKYSVDKIHLTDAQFPKAGTFLAHVHDKEGDVERVQEAFIENMLMYGSFRTYKEQGHDFHLNIPSSEYGYSMVHSGGYAAFWGYRGG